jgi:hypothetical protein
MECENLFLRTAANPSELPDLKVHFLCQGMHRLTSTVRRVTTTLFEPARKGGICASTPRVFSSNGRFPSSRKKDNLEKKEEST